MDCFAHARYRIPEWAEGYMDYKGLRRLLNLALAGQISSSGRAEESPEEGSPEAEILYYSGSTLSFFGI